MVTEGGRIDLGIDTVEADESGYYLYWRETGKQPFDGAVCTKCYVADPIPRRVRKRKTPGSMDGGRVLRLFY